MCNGTFCTQLIVQKPVVLTHEPNSILTTHCSQCLLLMQWQVGVMIKWTGRWCWLLELGVQQYCSYSSSHWVYACAFAERKRVSIFCHTILCTTQCTLGKHKDNACIVQVHSRAVSSSLHPSSVGARTTDKQNVTGTRPVLMPNPLYDGPLYETISESYKRPFTNIPSSEPIYTLSPTHKKMTVGKEDNMSVPEKVDVPPASQHSSDEEKEDCYVLMQSTKKEWTLN